MNLMIIVMIMIIKLNVLFVDQGVFLLGLLVILVEILMGVLNVILLILINVLYVSLGILWIENKNVYEFHLIILLLHKQKVMYKYYI